MGEVTAREIAVINQALIEEYGEGGAMTPAEIAASCTTKICLSDSIRSSG